MKVRKTILPKDSAAAKYFPMNFAETLAVDVSSGNPLSPDDLQVGFWTAMPAWISFLFKLRNLLVKPFGLSGGGRNVEEFKKAVYGGSSYGIMSVTDKTPKETILRLDDKHLSAYLSVYVEALAQANAQRVFVTTLVRFHKRFGRFYFYSIYPIHGLVVKAQLKRVLKRQIKK